MRDINQFTITEAVKKSFAAEEGSRFKYLLDTLLERETDPGVLDAVLRAAARTTGPELRVLVHRTALLLVRTAEGAVRLDRTLADLARHVPGLAAAVAGWLTDAPHVWGPLVGPATREVIDELTGAAVPV